MLGALRMALSDTWDLGGLSSGLVKDGITESDDLSVGL